jgi:hypothetical protein
MDLPEALTVIKGAYKYARDSYRVTTPTYQVIAASGKEVVQG